MKIFLATKNPGKIAEFKEILSGLNLDLVTCNDLEIPEYLLTKYKFKIIDINSLEELERLEKIIILAEPGKIQFSELHLIISLLKAFDAKKFSWIYVNKKLSKF